MQYDPNNPTMQNLSYSFTPLIVQSIIVFAILGVVWYLTARFKKKAK